MFSRHSELKIPDAAKADPQAREILRIWLAGGGQHVSFKTGVWDDPAAWGLMPADLARHVANSYTAVVEKTVKGKDASGAYNSASVWVKQDGKWVTVVHSEAKAR
jgi:hypothetical protein